MTNGERIRSMSDAELARFLTKSAAVGCRYCVYEKFADPEDIYACVRLGWDCVYGRTKWLEQEELKR